MSDELARPVQMSSNRGATAASASSGRLSLEQAQPSPTADQALWAAIRNRSEAIGFPKYRDFIDAVLCADSEATREGHRLLFREEMAWPDRDTTAIEEAFERRGYKVRDLEWINQHTVNAADADAACGGETVYQVRREGEGAAFYRRPGPAEQALRDKLRGGTMGRFYGTGAYELLKAATEVFLLMNCGVSIDGATLDETGEAGRMANRDDVSAADLVRSLSDYLGSGALPYLDRIASAGYGDGERITSPFCHGILATNITCPCLLELIWSYWHEEGMLTQSIKAITLRFQNKRLPGGRDPLAHLEIDPLRPLNNFLWGYLQEERGRLTVARRAYEYDHHYGISLVGKAVSRFHPADSRSKFLEGYHSLLRTAVAYYRDAADATMVPDGFPLLNAIKEVHLELSAGAHNQFRDLPWTSRVEMLIEQWMLSRPEMRDFIGTRAMVPYPEDWMGRVDTIKKMQGWTDTTVRHFRDLGVFGERLILSLRYGDWSNVSDEGQAKNWASYWKQEIQGYIHAYRAATGVDLGGDLSNAETAQLVNAQPAVHLRRKLAEQSRAR